MDENIADLVVRPKAKKYKTRPVLRVYIPKPNGEWVSLDDAHA